MRTKISGAGAEGVFVELGGTLLDRVTIKDSTLDGLHVVEGGNEFVKVKASGSGALDVVDEAGAAANTYTNCKFGNASPP